MRQTMLLSHDAETLLASPIAFDCHLQDIVADNFYHERGISHVKSNLIEVTMRRCVAYASYTNGRLDMADCLDILVVEVPPKIRRRGIFTKFLFILEQQKFLLRFHNVQNLWLQDVLIKNGFVLDGEYWRKWGGRNV